ncbi:thioesterase II family protein [Nocardia sp. CNY236]|uniref:thioesterase II family protein n=1 Tax=Nocardia sp. CNY236 TaxID=1169152 RepID=UPI00068573D8|nr:alpha/beta fold hydrolase [Nocardia sp. CNY236]
MDDEQTWFRHLHPEEEAQHRLVCFPHAGGSASYFQPVARALAPDIEVIAVQYPGRQDRRNEPGIDDIGVLADHIHAIMRTWPCGPLTFFGHSMGAVIAFEVARRLRRDDPGWALHLFASGRRAPHLHRSEAVHLRDDAGIIAEVRSLGGTESQLLQDPELLEMILPALRSDYRAVERYRFVPDGPPPCSITVLTGDRDPQTTIDEAREWIRHSQDPFDLRVFRGGHFFLSDNDTAVSGVLSEHFTATGPNSRATPHRMGRVPPSR